MTDCYITIIGGGIIGNSISYELSKLIDNETICLLEKNKNFPGENQTSRNSGVIHAGIYYDRSHSPLKARLCVEGNQLLYDFCKEYNLPARQTGKLIVSTNTQEDKMLENLLLQSQINKVPGVKKINAGEVKEIEPNVNSYSALFVPTSGIIDPISLVCKLKDLSQLGNYFFCGTEVKDLTPKNNEFVIKASTFGIGEYDFSTKYLINSAGLESDVIAKMINPNFPLKIFSVRGESVKFYQSRDNLSISRNIYSAPIFYQKPDGSKHLTVGVHLTPTFSGDNLNELGKEVTIGPLNKKKGIRKDDFGSDLAHPSEFLENIKNYFPGICLEDLQFHQTGIQAVLANSQDFHIARDKNYPNIINLVGICSPGLTSSLAIAKFVRNFFE